MKSSPVKKTDQINDNTYLFTLEDGREYEINFSVQGGVVVREIHIEKCIIYDDLDFINNVKDAVQWTANNFDEVLYLEEAYNEF